MDLRQFRKKHNISQQKMAKQIGISQNLLSKIELKERYPSFELALKIEEYTKQIDPDPENYIKATDLINPKKLKEYKLLQKVLK